MNRILLIIVLLLPFLVIPKVISKRREDPNWTPPLSIEIIVAPHEDMMSPEDLDAEYQRIADQIESDRLQGLKRIDLNIEPEGPVPPEHSPSREF